MTRAKANFLKLYSMPDSSQNGHSPAPSFQLRPPVGERAARGLAADENALLAEETRVLEAEPVVENSPVLAPVEVAERAEHDPATDEPGEEEAVLAAWGGGGEPPSIGDDFGNESGGSGDSNTPRDQELGLMAHLAELRTRILWCVVAVFVAMFLTWNKCVEIQDWFAYPIKEAIKGKGTLISISPTGFFTIYLQVSLVSSLIVTMPFILFQVWRFIEPALTNNERKYTLVLVPFSSVLFFLGAGMGYLMTPMFFKFFLLFQPTGVLANWDYFESVMLMAKTLLVFGIAFQVPVFTIFLNKTGIVSRNVLIQYWRHAIVIIFTVIAFVTPTWDPLTMTVCALPPCLLYLLSIWLVKWL